MASTTNFVQEPDYVGLRKTNLPVQALGAIYDGLDPYVTPLGIIVLVLERNFAREIYVPRGTRRMESGEVIYQHDLLQARYVNLRNGFEVAQLQTGVEALTDEAKSLIRTFLEAQNNPEMNKRFVIQATG